MSRDKLVRVLQDALLERYGVGPYDEGYRNAIRRLLDLITIHCEHCRKDT